MQRKFLTNLALILFLNILVKPLYIFGIDLGVQNLVGPDEYGLFFSMFNFSMLFNIFLDFGITNYNNRNISQYKHLLNKHFSGIVSLRFILAAAYAVVSVSVGLMAGYSSRQMGLLGVLIVNQFIISSTLYLRSNIAGLQLFRTDSLISVLDRLVLIVLCGFLIYSARWRTGFTVEVFAGCQTVAYLVALIAALVVVIRKASFRRFYWNPTFARMIIRNSFPYAMLTMLMMFYFRIDSVLLERLLPDGIGARQSGIYASAFRLLDAFIMIPYLFSVLLLPMFSKMIRYKENVGQIISIALPILLLFSIGMVGLSLAFNQEIMMALYPAHAAESTAVFSFLMPGLIAFSVSYIFGTLLTANGSIRVLNLIAGASMVLNVTLNILLIPTMEAVGSAMASCLTLFLSALLQVWISAGRFNLVPPRKDLFRFFLFMAGMILILWLQDFIPLHWGYRFLISGTAILLHSFVIGFIKPLQLISIMKKS